MSKNLTAATRAALEVEIGKGRETAELVSEFKVSDRTIQRIRQRLGVVARSPKDDPEVRQEEERVRLQQNLREARNRAAAAEKRAYEAEKYREKLFGLTKDAADVPRWALEKSTAGDAPHTAVLLASDFQLGEVIDAENLDGLNAFDIEVAKGRYRRLVERTIDLCREHLPRNRYDGLFYLRLGDMVSGDIHEELRETNEEGGIQAVRTLVEMEAWGVAKFKEAFGQVHVVSVPGNHGRTSKKPPYKKVAETNLDTLSAWWLESVVKGAGVEGITWQTPNSTDALIDVYGRRLLASHGDNIGTRGGQGFVGPAATIARGMQLVAREYAARGTPLWRQAYGHFHTALDLGYGWSNGSLPGYSEFARGNRMVPEPPCQWLLLLHPKYGATSQWRVWLEDPRLPAAKAEVPWRQ